MNEVGRAHSKPIPSSQETSTTSVPGASGQIVVRQERQRRIGVLQNTIDDHIVVGEELGERYPSLGRQGSALPGIGVVEIEIHDVGRVNGRTDGRDTTLGEDVDVVDAVRVQSGDRTAGRGPEADDRGTQPSAVIAGGTDQLQCVQHRAVAGQFVVLVEHMEIEPAVGRPVIHGLERDQCQLTFDGDLGECSILDAVRPTPQRLSGAQRGKILGLRLRQQNHVAPSDEFGTGADARNLRGQVLVGQSERLAVAGFEKHAGSDVGIDAIEMKWMNRKSPLIRLA